MTMTSSAPPKRISRSDRQRLSDALAAARIHGADREAIIRLFAEIEAERDEAVRQLRGMRRTLEHVTGMLRGPAASAGARAERALRFLDAPIAERER